MQAKAGASLISSVPERSPLSTGRSPRSSRVWVRRVPIVLALAAVAITLDRLTKAWALANLEPGVPRPFLGEILQLNLLFNPGAAFSLGTGMTPVFTIIMTVVAIAVLVMMFRVRSMWWTVGLGFLLGGAVGNLIDRLTRPPGFARGHVVDFLQLPHWPVFNIADSSVVTAACVIGVAAFRGIPFGRQPAPAADSQSDAAATDPTEGTSVDPHTHADTPDDTDKPVIRGERA